MIRGWSVKNVKNPPGQVKPTHVPNLNEAIQQFFDSEELFSPEQGRLRDNGVAPKAVTGRQQESK